MNKYIVIVFVSLLSLTLSADLKCIDAKTKDECFAKDKGITSTDERICCFYKWTLKEGLKTTLEGCGDFANNAISRGVEITAFEKSTNSTVSDVECSSGYLIASCLLLLAFLF